ncbi:hypothetical protein Tco_0876030 [Tanacetum coccineum]|uniref:Uncharacterized protein n=1 Tax=Tanacetum coccineum TaxID=301880 RepID=A0ABQ5BW50_9ASTR
MCGKRMNEGFMGSIYKVQGPLEAKVSLQYDLGYMEGDVESLGSDKEWLYGQAIQNCGEEIRMKTKDAKDRFVSLSTLVMQITYNIENIDNAISTLTESRPEI